MGEAERECICGERWNSPTHRRRLKESGRRWKSNAGLIYPHRQWIAENLPQGRDGYTLAADDGLIRVYGANDQLGYVWPLEVKSFGRDLDTATDYTLRALANGRLNAALVLTLVGGNTPGPLRHFPRSCECCGLPDHPVVAEAIELNRSHVSGPDQLRDLLANPWEAQRRSMNAYWPDRIQP